MGSFAHLEAYQKSLAKEVHQLASLGVRFVGSSEGGVIVQNRAESSLAVEVKEKQYNNPLLLQLKEVIHKHKTMDFSLGMEDGTLRYQGRLCVPDVDSLRERIKTEDHHSMYSVNPGLPRTSCKFDSIWAIVDQLTKSAHFLPIKATDTAEQRCRSLIGWFETEEAELIGPDPVHQVMEKFKIIKEQLKTVQSRQKSYSD
uniref:Uncharacterized protein LOC104225056 n=1 Tax=Nicotiana sylvestris TaxID=4096 RepID=A0A1U7WLH8_NICSY